MVVQIQNDELLCCTQAVVVEGGFPASELGQVVPGGYCRSH